jgi:surface antigen
MLGYIVGNEMDKFDRQELNGTYETAPSGQAASWRNPDSGNEYQEHLNQPTIPLLSRIDRAAKLRS